MKSNDYKANFFFILWKRPFYECEINTNKEIEDFLIFKAFIVV